MKKRAKPGTMFSKRRDTLFGDAPFFHKQAKVVVRSAAESVAKEDGLKNKDEGEMSPADLDRDVNLSFDNQSSEETIHQSQAL